MSKIEKALSKARTAGHLRVVSSGHSSERSLIPVERRTTDRGPEQRASSSKAIARMEEKNLLSKDQLVKAGFIHPELAENRTIQAFREIRTKILQKSQGTNCIIMVTSISSDSGSSFVAQNLAAAFAFDAGKTALLLDCNLRDPSFHKLVLDQDYRGLIDYLENDNMDISQIIYPVGIPRLRIIPAGGKREIPAEYFTSLKMKSLLERIRQRYQERFIIIDAPPMTESADTQILSELCDYVLLVVPYGRVTSSKVVASVKSVEINKFLGVVFNNEPHIPLHQWRDFIPNPFAAFVKKKKKPSKANSSKKAENQKSETRSKKT